MLIGSSVGAISAAFLSTGLSVDGALMLVQAWEVLDRRDVFRFGPLEVLAGLVGIREHLVSAYHLS